MNRTFKFDFGNITEEKEEWMKSLSEKENILYGTTPYMPILVENISNYMCLDDFECQRLKEIQTVGIIYGKEWHEAAIYHHNNIVSVKVIFTCCKRDKLEKNGYKLETKIPCKLLGRLIKIEEAPVIEVHHFVKINDLPGTLRTLTLLSQIVRQKYHYYACSKNP